MDNNAHYVKFMRGSISAWNTLLTTPEKIDNDTLYFIYESNTNILEGSLYLGQKLISGSNSGSTINLKNLNDIYIDDTSLDSFQLLVYDAGNEQWTNASLDDIINSTIGIFTGAKNDKPGTAGLVPTPQAGDQNKFLRGDGSWTPIIFDRDVFDVNDNTGDITLADFKAANVGTIPIKTNAGIEWAPIGAGGVSRQIISLADLNEAIANNTASGNTIYMIPIENPTDSSNQYEEYMVVQGKLELVGTLGNVNLADYVTKSAFQQNVTNINNLLNDPDNGLISRVAILESGVGNLDNFYSYYNTNNLVDEIAAINSELVDLTDRLEWHELPN